MVVNDCYLRASGSKPLAGDQLEDVLQLLQKFHVDTCQIPMYCINVQTAVLLPPASSPATTELKYAHDTFLLPESFGMVFGRFSR